MKKIFQKIWNTITTILVIVVFILASILVVPKLVGMDIYVVLSGSMEPIYPTGGIIIVQDVDVADLEVSDVITFQLSDDVIATHRIVEIVDEENGIAYQTKGDANEHVDANLVSPSQVIGSPKYSIPYMGYLISYIQNPPGRYVAIALGISVVLMVALSDLLFEDDEKEKITEEISVENKEEEEDEKK